MVKKCEKKAVRRPRRKNTPLHRKGKWFFSVEPGLKKDEAIREAQRCLGVNECESCEVCSLFCPDLCITRDEASGSVLIDLDYCKGCGICASVCPKGAIHMVLEETG